MLVLQIIGLYLCMGMIICLYVIRFLLKNETDTDEILGMSVITMLAWPGAIVIYAMRNLLSSLTIVISITALFIPPHHYPGVWVFIALIFFVVWIMGNMVDAHWATFTVPRD